MKIQMGAHTGQVATPPPPPEPRQPKKIRAWPYDPDAETMLAWTNTAVNHFIAIRASGSLPLIGGPSFTIGTPTTEAGFREASEAAEGYWPNARQFDLIGSDLEYQDSDYTVSDPGAPGPVFAPSKVPISGMAPGMTRLRTAAIITTFAVTDRPPIEPPEPPATQQDEAAAPSPEAS